MSARRAEPSALAVLLHGRRVGMLTRLAGDRHLFAFEEEYLGDPARPVLSLSFKGASGNVVSDATAYRVRVPPFFANLLPEGPLRARLAELAGVKAQRDFPLLAALGADLPGATVVRSLEHSEADEEAVELEPPDRSAAARRRALRFSLAGVQLKFSVLLEATGGLTVPVGGQGGSWIVKLPSPLYPAVPENEFAMLELAHAIGITVPERRLVPIGSIEGLPADAARLPGNALAVRRFDRLADGTRVHMEDFAQIFARFPDDKYDGHSYANIAAVLRAEAGEASTFEFFRRLVFSVLIGNGDMHLKNWSVLYPDARTATLSPAYDFVATTPYLPDDELSLGFGRSRSLHRITREQVRRFADTARLATSPLWEIVRETSERTVDAWKSLDARRLLPAELRAALHTQIETAARGVER